MENLEELLDKLEELIRYVIRDETQESSHESVGYFREIAETKREIIILAGMKNE